MAGLSKMTEVDEPVSITVLTEEDRDSVQCVSHHSQSLVRHHIRFQNGVDIANVSKQHVVPNVAQELQPILSRKLEIQMENIVVPGMVQRMESPLMLVKVVGRAGDVVHTFGGKDWGGFW